MVVFHKNGDKGCVEMIFRMDEGEEIPNIDQLIKEIPEFFEEEEVNEFDEFSTLEQLEQENPGYFGE